MRAVAGIYSAWARAAARSRLSASAAVNPRLAQRSGGPWRAAASAAAAAAAAAGLAGAAWAAPAADGAPQAARQPPPGAGAGGLPTDKLSCKRAAAPPRTPCVLVSCGSFNPPTNMHLRMCELAAEELGRRGYDVWGCYLSPVADPYGKAHLAPARHRIEMARLAAEGSPLVMVDDWEARQEGYTRTLAVLRRVQAELDALVGWRAASSAADGAGGAGGAEGASEGGGEAAGAPRRVRVMLLCGADLLATMAVPGVWRGAGALLREHGAVVVAREGTDLEALLGSPGGASPGAGSPEASAAASGGPAGGSPAGASAAAAAPGGADDDPSTVLRANRDAVVVVVDPLPNSMSSTRVRAELAAGRGAEGMAPDAVLRYARRHGLYGAAGGGGGGGGGGTGGGSGGGSGGIAAGL
ncbi:nicotinamide nicotinic acid mononucleotide adenylyltransferase [Raphidocelis subcapitata]|uniref:Nicotinamide nicotinic acid mononucleotide adenylyltransferase n=1 Tax=Raphidocelis subcapitata TaxID=307507 RepID=A0A2V0P9Q0_9CHLO|nr:nicotinamide nicotinic acid mononucleotide adenylyltransferase [Raphidocelis subcapitata]|eukprot:GBF96571.1 nicotinamide nicotinic acid mononucleotide adenylyltransferase [Raphidocelis subcapitata]